MQSKIFIFIVGVTFTFTSHTKAVPLNMVTEMSLDGTTVPVIVLDDIENVEETTIAQKDEDQKMYTPKPPKQQSNAVIQLLQVLDSTISNLDDVIIRSIQNVTEEGQMDFERVGGILRSIHTYLTEKSSTISKDAEHQLASSIKDIQTFLNDHHSQLNKHFLYSRNATSKSNNATTHSHSNSSSLVDRGSRKIDNNNAQQTSNDAMGRFLSIPSKVGQSLRSTINGAESIFTSSINQIQTQIQNIFQGVNNFFTTAGNTFSQQIPNLFNLTLPTTVTQVKKRHSILL